MNERIKELLKQAAKLANTEHNKDFDRSFDMIVAEKFAQLIVEECADVAWRNTPETEELEYSHLISDKIKQHFGVE